METSELLDSAQKHPNGTWVIGPPDYILPTEIVLAELTDAIKESPCRVVLQPDRMNQVAAFSPRLRVRLMDEDLSELDLLELLEELGAEADGHSKRGSVFLSVEHAAAAVEILEGALG